jgi:all-trans-retinol dehydrogenase (NAD+)
VTGADSNVILMKCDVSDLQ